jgi:hypothetical protein
MIVRSCRLTQPATTVEATVEMGVARRARGGSHKNGLVQFCDCPRRISVSSAVAAKGPIACGSCYLEFVVPGAVDSSCLSNAHTQVREDR